MAERLNMRLEVESIGRQLDRLLLVVWALAKKSSCAADSPRPTMDREMIAANDAS